MTFFVETLIHIFGVCFRAGRGFRWWYCRSNKDKAAKLKHARKISVKRFAASGASENLKQCSGGATFWVGGWPVVQNVVVEQYAKIPSVLTNVLADRDSEVSSKTPHMHNYM